MSLYIKYIGNLGGGGSGGGGVTTVGTYDTATPSANGAVISGSSIFFQSASATLPGMVSTASQTFAGSKTFNSTIIASSGVDVASGTLSIGTTNASTINIGHSGVTVNILGTTLYENVTTLNVSNPLINLNVAGGAGSGSSVGMTVEEATVVTGYVQTSGDRNSWLLKAPNTAGTATITPGSSGITLDQSSHNPVTLGTANGLSLSVQVLSLGLSSTSTTGALSSTDWNTFNSKQAALTFGNLTDAGTDGIVITGGTGAVIGSGTSIAQHVSDSTHNGYLSSTDWSIFNAKQPAGSYITALTGDVTASGPGSAVATLKNTGTAGTYVKVTTDAQGRVTSGSASPLGPTDGGTGLSSYTTGDTLYASATNTLSKLSIGSTNQILTVIAGIPSWQSPAAVTFTAPSVQTFTSGSGTYTAPTSPAPLYIRVRAVGAGGGGGGSGSSGNGTGTNGGDTTFGASTAGGGGGGPGSATAYQYGGTGGTATIGAGAIGSAIPGSQGGSTSELVLASTSTLTGGYGGTSGLGIGGSNGPAGANPPMDAPVNSGAGGGGGGTGNASGSYTGAGGGAGGFLDILISPVSATYSYSIGAAGSGGAAGTSGNNGAAGGSGYIEITEYYQ